LDGECDHESYPLVPGPAHRREFTEHHVNRIQGKLITVRNTCTFILVNVKCKVKSKAVPQHTYGGAGGERRYDSCSLTTSALDGGGSLAALYPRERTLGTHWTGGWVGPRTGLDTEARRKIIFCLHQGSKLDHPVIQSVPRH
jgi:hypothetical protein